MYQRHVFSTHVTSISYLLKGLHTCQVEDAKIALILFGGKTSQITKDVLSDLHKLKSSASTDHCDLPLRHQASCQLHLQVRLNKGCQLAG